MAGAMVEGKGKRSTHTGGTGATPGNSALRSPLCSQASSPSQAPHTAREKGEGGQTLAGHAQQLAPTTKQERGRSKALTSGGGSRLKFLAFTISSRPSAHGKMVSFASAFIAGEIGHSSARTR